MMLRQRGGPLAGVRVLELTKVWAGPYAGKLLAFLGAEVIKVESMAQLDEMRAYGGVDINSAPYFLSINQEVLSVQINMKSADGMELLGQLIARSDVLIDNLRPGAMERVGLAYEDVRKIRPDIIQASIKMYGNDGPLGYQTGYAPCFAALGGLTSLVGYPHEPPRGMNIRYGDSTVGASAAFAIIAALHHRETTGEGQFIDVSAVETMSSMIGDSLFACTATGEVPRAEGNADPVMAPHGCYPCAGSEWLSLAIANDEEWRLANAILGINAEGLETAGSRLANAEILDGLVAHKTCNRDAEELASELRAAGCAAFRSQSSLDLVSDDYLWDSGAFRMVGDAAGNSRPVNGPGWNMEPDGPEIRHAAPQLGEHNDYVFGQILGLPADEIGRLQGEQAIY